MDMQQNEDEKHKAVSARRGEHWNSQCLHEQQHTFYFFAKNLRCTCVTSFIRL
ncbi:hypothetical protein BVRB_8g198880 [Beta vulgaris subsp. vulgaris]|nr:hypothetical protein BVRB_8g198880 [Beta vulgaris subsp. vulgaris]